MHGGQGSMIIIRGFWTEYCEIESHWLHGCSIWQSQPSLGTSNKIEFQSLCDLRTFGRCRMALEFYWRQKRVWGSNLWHAFSQCKRFVTVSAEILSQKLSMQILLQQAFLFFIFIFFPLFHVIWNSAGWWAI